MTNDPSKPKNARLGFSPVMSKILLMLVLSLLLQVPTCQILSLSNERQARKQSVSEEIMGKAGGQQMVMGPLLTVPYIVRTQWEEDIVNEKTKKNEKRRHELTESHNIRVMPGKLDVAGALKTEYRHRGIYKVPVYTADLKMSGWFALPDTAGLVPANSPTSVTEIQWDKAILSVSVSGIEGLRSPIAGTFDQKEVALRPDTFQFQDKKSVGSAAVSVDPAGKRLPFSLSFSLEGAMGLYVVPVGQVTEMNISSDWASPNFAGKYPPVARSISDHGFAAKWRVMDLNTNFPGAWLDETLFPALPPSAFGVELADPVNDSLLFERSVKYCILFVALTFFALFVSELMAKARLHFIQYLLPGLAVVIFYLLLLSLSEHIGFSLAYVAAATAVVILVTIYVAGIMQKAALGLLTGGVLGVLYGYWFVILQLEDYALVCGSVGTFVLLASVMIATRKLDWRSLDARLGRIIPRAPDAPDREPELEI